MDICKLIKDFFTNYGYEVTIFKLTAKIYKSPLSDGITIYAHDDILIIYKPTLLHFNLNDPKLFEKLTEYIESC